MISLALLGACKKSAKPDCDGAGKAVEKAAADAAAKTTDALTRETALRVGPAAAANIVLRCKQDGWTAAATDCVKANTTGNFRECESKLTKDQNDKLRVGIPSGDPAATGSAAVAPTGPAADCDAVERAMTTFWNQRVASAATDTERKAGEAMRVAARARIGKHCREDGWSAEAATCFGGITNGDFASCESKLTPMQVGNLRNSAPPMSGTDGMHGGSAAGSAEAGSAAGSAAAGSAADGSAAPTP